MPFSLGGPELLIILALVLIIFGAGKLPNAFKDFGRGVKDFKKAKADDGTDVMSAPPGAPVAAPTRMPLPIAAPPNAGLPLPLPAAWTLDAAPPQRP